MKLLLVEDEPKLNRGIVQGLQERGYAVDAALDGEEGENKARMNTYDVIILDVMLPKQDGFTVCKKIRAAGIMTPVLFLTARSGVHDRVEGLNLGGDDYLIKPFSFEELTARIRSILRRAPQVTGDVFTLDELQLDTRSQSVTVNGKNIDFTLREYGLLEYLLRNKGAVVNRQEILDHVWDRFADTLTNVVDVHLKNIRKKLPAKYAKRIETIWGKGYRLS